MANNAYKCLFLNIKVYKDSIWCKGYLRWVMGDVSLLGQMVISELAKNSSDLNF